MNNILLLETVNSALEQSETLLEVLFTKQLPATLTFIAAVLGILAQVFIGVLSLRKQRKEETRKNAINCIRCFYIAILKDLICYDTNIKILHSKGEDINIFDSNNSINAKYSETLKQIHESIQNIAVSNYENYYPIGKEINRETISMLSYMMLAAKILDTPMDERGIILDNTGIPQNGYDVANLLELICKKIEKG